VKSNRSLSGLILALLLSGCQLTPTSEQTAIDTNTLSAPATLPPPIAPDKPSISGRKPASELPAETVAESTPLLAPADQADLWLRISSQLTLPVADNPQIAALQDWYLSHPLYMSQITERAEPFLYLIVTEVERRNLPLELALLPIVESAFDPFAESSGGAAGLWQFMPATGKRFQLEQNWWYDGRRDVLASTNAALDYLEYLNRLFDGDWLHTLAAYNSGEGRVLAAIKNNRLEGRPTDFWSLSLPLETQGYVPKLLALSAIMQHPERLGLSFPALPNRQVVTEVAIDSQLDLTLAAELAGMDPEQLRRLNPGFRRWITAPDGPHRLLLPQDRASRLALALAKLEPRQRLKWNLYVVMPGDTLSTIAARHNTRTEVLVHANNLDSTRIRINQTLQIPTSADKPADTSHPATASATHYQVKAGDTLWDIGRVHRVSVRQLASWNGISTSAILKPGQRLTVYTAATSEPSTTYRVRSGDSLSTIASKFNVKVADLIRWNQLDRDRYLQPGQTLKLFLVAGSGA